MYKFIKRVKTLEDRVEKLETVVLEMSRKTISEKTIEVESVSFSQIVDEWLNGGKEDSNGN